MPKTSVRVHRLKTLLRPAQTRVLLRRFQPGGPERTAGILQRILRMPPEDVSRILNQLTSEFSQRHQHLEAVFQARYQEVVNSSPLSEAVSSQQRLLIGAYFLAEYSLESAALFNPSIVPHPDQSSAPAGGLAFVLSLRATGEGHISSITFRSGIIHTNHLIDINKPTGYLTEAPQSPNPNYDKALFVQKLRELGLDLDYARRVMEALPENFSRSALQERLDSLSRKDTAEDVVARGIASLASSIYEVQFPLETELSERVLFPATPTQRNGIEDARFVRFVEDDGRAKYFGCFTAYDGQIVMPELVETEDFSKFRFCTLNGRAATNKGMALFPRRIQGRFAMLGRQDNESISLMYSGNVHFWDEKSYLLSPAQPWELIQIGNCGSPLEIPEGWLVLSHGVGPMRQYYIGAFLLDKEDPSKVLGRLREPLLSANSREREGYVPNVVYTCGGILHNGRLILPYGLADHATGFATASLSDILAAMQ